MSTKLIGLILLPLYTSYLTTEEYGIFAILEVTSQLFTIIFGLQLSTAMLRFSSSEKCRFKRKSIFWRAFERSILVFYDCYYFKSNNNPAL
jgi:O-antigen/teichoic acid export membrane protein